MKWMCKESGCAIDLQQEGDPPDCPNCGEKLVPRPEWNGSIGVERILAERKRQVEGESWSEGHDDTHTSGELAWAAACYAAPDSVLVSRSSSSRGFYFVDPWPWDQTWDKRTPRDPKRREALQLPPRTERALRIRELEKAGALIAAEIDRLVRAHEEEALRDEPTH